MRGTEPPLQPDAMGVVVSLPDGRVLRLRDPFLIGRDGECEIQIEDIHVSRRHAEVLRLREEWVIRDLQSSNGLFVDGERVDTAPIGEGVAVALGAYGPVLRVDPETLAEATPAGRAEPPPEEGTLLNAYAQRYFGSEGDESVGDRTLMIRKAFQKIQVQQRRRHRWTISAVALVAVCAGFYALYAYRLISQQTEQAQKIFYSMKALDVQFAQLQQKMAQSGNALDQPQIAQYMAQHREMEHDYNSYVSKLYDRGLNEKERLILHVTRMFGECEVAAPPDYIGEVMRYIRVWQSTGRFARAVKLAQDSGYTQRIAAAFIAQDLPPQYFYLAMQESGFDAFTSGPQTRWGIAKGMWQFIPETGARYGLKIGPLASVPRPDPADERFQWEKATGAAARYVKDIYATDAQASGLLVMASYNWGEFRVIDILRKMPADPRERNFWKLLAQHKDRVPLQTYEYVFNIVSAAVIGENPRLFGFQFDSPLKFLEQR
jgi:membrane-bound lytic murein transglycosylase D